MKYTKQEFISGNWVKGSQIQSGLKCKLVSEVKPQESQWQNKDGSPKFQDVAKIKFQGINEEMNISLNRATINGLVDAFGEDSVAWGNKVLPAVTEKARVAGKNVTMIYLLADGYEKVDDANGYAAIVKKGSTAETLPSIEEGADLPF